MRSLVRDLGETLGCGAHVASLRRLWVDPFREPRMLGLEQLLELAGQGEALLDACLLPIEAGLVAWPVVSLDEEQARRLGQGQAVFLPDASLSGEVHVTGPTGRSLGLGTMDGAGNLRVLRLFRWAT